MLQVLVIQTFHALYMMFHNEFLINNYTIH